MTIGDRLRVMNAEQLFRWAVAAIVDTLDMNVPVGTILETAGATADTGFLLCDGTSYLRATYPTLFARIGTTYGSADGTHFNVPDKRGKFSFGKAASGTGSTLGGTFGTIDHTHTSAAHVHTSAAHTHTAPAHYHGMGTGADLIINLSGSHHHTINESAISEVGGGGYGLTVAAAFANRPMVDNTGGRTTSNDTHGHTPTDFGGRIGLVTGGVDGNAAMTSGSTTPADTGSTTPGVTGTNNPPAIATNFQIRY